MIPVFVSLSLSSPQRRQKNGPQVIYAFATLPISLKRVTSRKRKEGNITRKKRSKRIFDYLPPSRENGGMNPPSLFASLRVTGTRLSFFFLLSYSFELFPLSVTKLKRQVSRLLQTLVGLGRHIASNVGEVEKKEQPSTPTSERGTKQLFSSSTLSSGYFHHHSQKSHHIRDRK